MGSKPKVAAFIPARGGSKSIPLKNIRTIGGRPLIYWTTRACADCKAIDHTFVATDSEQIRQCVSGFGLKSVEVIGRSNESATDVAASEIALLEFAKASQFDHIVMVQATSPLLRSDDVEGALQTYFQSKADSLLTVVRTKRFIWEQKKDGLANPMNYDPADRPRRQDWSGQLVENGALYVSSRDAILQSRCRISGKTAIYEMPEETYLEIDEPADWSIAEILISKRQRDTWSDTIGDIKLLCVDVDGTMTDAGMYYGPQGEALKKFNTRDAAGLARIRKLGIEVIIVTSEDTPIVTARARKLQIDEVCLGVKNKVQTVEQLLATRGLSWDNVAYIGDDLNDLEAIKRAGFSACPADSVQAVQSAAMYICQIRGGYGALREVCDLIEEAQTA